VSKFILLFIFYIDCFIFFIILITSSLFPGKQVTIFHFNSFWIIHATIHQFWLLFKFLLIWNYQFFKILNIRNEKKYNNFFHTFKIIFKVLFYLSLKIQIYWLYLIKMGKQWKQCQTLFWGAPKSLQIMTAAVKLKDAYSLEGKLWRTW